MRHGEAHRKFSRTSAHRKALFRNMATEFFRRERFETTEAKAKSLRPIAEKLVTLAKSGTLDARRRAYGYITDKAVVHKLFADIAPRYKERKGGYTRIYKTDHRDGDAAPMAFIELV